MEKFEVPIHVRWADIDQNQHVRHSAYYDYGAHTRIQYFRKVGFDMGKLTELNIGPIIFKEECSFLREIHPNDDLIMNLQKGEMREDVSRWTFHHEIYNQHGKKCAHISLKGAFMDLTARKLVAPPSELAKALLQLPEGEPYVYRKL